MGRYCENCGCLLSGGICSNCQEELYIIENQSEYIEKPLSEEFMRKANEQKEELKRRSNG